jgi:lysozyme family protein
MWPNFDGKAYNRAQLAAHINSLDFSKWKRKDGSAGRPKFIVLHNTSEPTIKQWLSWSAEKRRQYIQNVQHYYESDLRWHAGPHFFVPPELDPCCYGFSDPTTAGTHASCFNSDSIGIEMVGEFNVEAFDSGPGEMVRDDAVYLCALLCNKLGLDPAAPYVYGQQGLHFHIDCKADNHDCPGTNVRKVKAELMARIKTEMARLKGQAPALPAPSPVPAPAPVPVVTGDLRRRMAKAIVDFEARRDSKGRLVVYKLPPEDGGGTYEVAGINDGYDTSEAAKLAAMVRAGKQQKAEAEAADYIARFTDPAAQWSINPGVQFYLRDCFFNRGAKGAARILQRALRVNDDGVVGKQTRDAMGLVTNDELLARLRVAREQYERDVKHRNESSSLWKGLVNRWNNALNVARDFNAGVPPAPAAAPKAPIGAVAAAGTAAAAATGGALTWLDARPIVAIAVGVLLAGAIVAGIHFYKRWRAE